MNEQQNAYEAGLAQSARIKKRINPSSRVGMPGSPFNEGPIQYCGTCAVTAEQQSYSTMADATAE